MTTALWFLASMVVSVVALTVLTQTNRKRRRVYFDERNPSTPAWVTTTSWLTVFLPGVLLLALNQYTAFLSWLGALGTTGWLIAARRPDTQAAAVD